jgi:hypothetical protein
MPAFLLLAGLGERVNNAVIHDAMPESRLLLVLNESVPCRDSASTFN